MTALMSAHKVLRTGRTCERCGYWAQSVECRRLAETGEECSRPTWAAPEPSTVLDGPLMHRAFGIARPAPVIVCEPVRRARVLAPTESTVTKTVWAKRTKRNGHNTPVAKIALYVPPAGFVPTWKTWTGEELAAMGQTAERSEEWKRWYKAMPRKMTAKQEREYFLEGNS